MRIHLISIGHKMPAWIATGYQEYAKRLPPSCQLQLIEIAAEKRSKSSDSKRLQQLEEKAIQQAIPKNNHVVALTIDGQQWDTPGLAQQLKQWLASGQDISLLIGGAEGLSQPCLNIADQHWSLSALTFPHQFVRIMVAEQLYRAHSLLQHHPYHK